MSQNPFIGCWDMLGKGSKAMIRFSYYSLLLCKTEKLISFFDFEVSKVFANGSITPCLTCSVQIDKAHVSLILASNYFLDSFLNELPLDRLTFFVVAAWLLLSACLIFVDNNMAHLPDQKPLTWCQDCHGGEHGCSYLLEEF